MGVNTYLFFYLNELCPAACMRVNPTACCTPGDSGAVALLRCCVKIRVALHARVTSHHLRLVYKMIGQVSVIAASECFELSWGFPPTDVFTGCFLVVLRVSSATQSEVEALRSIKYMLKWRSNCLMYRTKGTPRAMSEACFLPCVTILLHWPLTKKKKKLLADIFETCICRKQICWKRFLK